MSQYHIPLLRAPGPEAIENITLAIRTAAKLFPVPSSHRRELPHAIRDLSRMLTEDRSEMSRPYWASPGLFSAYLHFFLPWNLYRLSWLLPGLDMPLQRDSRILDLGSGPLTLPIALWCVRPEFRELPLRFTCVDVSMQAMERGIALLKALGGEKMPWEIRLFRGPLEKSLPRPNPRDNSIRSYDCIMAANVLNELANERSKADSLEQRMAGIVEKIIGALRAGGKFFLVEPGTRLGGKVVSLARAAALERGCTPIAPCTHSGPCPMQAENEMEDDRRLPSFSGWCHFTHPVFNAPEALSKLGEETRLQKRSMALSCLLMQKMDASPLEEGILERNLEQLVCLDELESLFAEIMEDDVQNDTAVPRKASGVYQRPFQGPAISSSPILTRVISAPITLTGHEEPGRYACCEHGLALLLDARNLPSGALVEAVPPQYTSPSRHSGSGVRDVKTGALLLKRNDEKKKAAASQKPSSDRTRKTAKPVRDRSSDKKPHGRPSPKNSGRK